MDIFGKISGFFNKLKYRILYKPTYPKYMLENKVQFIRKRTRNTKYTIISEDKSNKIERKEVLTRLKNRKKRKKRNKTNRK